MFTFFLTRDHLGFVYLTTLFLLNTHKLTSTHLFSQSIPTLTIICLADAPSQIAYPQLILTLWSVWITDFANFLSVTRA